MSIQTQREVAIIETGMPQGFADRIRQALGDTTLTEAAAAAGIPRNTIAVWVTGRRQPNTEGIRALSDALGVSPGWLLFGDTDPVNTALDAWRDAYDASEMDGTPTEVAAARARLANAAHALRMVL